MNSTLPAVLCMAGTIYGNMWSQYQYSPGLIFVRYLSVKVMLKYVRYKRYASTIADKRHNIKAVKVRKRQLKWRDLLQNRRLRVQVLVPLPEKSQ